MSEDERIISSIKPIVNARKTHKDNYLYSLQLNAYQLDMIQGLLDLYNKEKEKNKKYEKADLTTVYLNGFYDGEKKWKDKIKEKLQRYYDKVHLADKNSPLDMYNQAVLNGKIQGLEDLLEEDNK